MQEWKLRDGIDCPCIEVFARVLRCSFGPSVCFPGTAVLEATLHQRKLGKCPGQWCLSQNTVCNIKYLLREEILVSVVPQARCRGENKWCGQQHSTSLYLHVIHFACQIRKQKTAHLLLSCFSCGSSVIWKEWWELRCGGSGNGGLCCCFFSHHKCFIFFMFTQQHSWFLCRKRIDFSICCHINARIGITRQLPVYSAAYKCSHQGLKFWAITDTVTFTVTWLRIAHTWYNQSPEHS